MSSYAAGTVVDIDYVGVVEVISGETRGDDFLYEAEEGYEGERFRISGLDSDGEWVATSARGTVVNGGIATYALVEYECGSRVLYAKSMLTPVSPLELLAEAAGGKQSPDLSVE